MAGDEHTDDEPRPDPDDSQAPGDPQSNLEQTVDAMEERVLGDSAASASEDEEEEENLSPAFEQDLDPEDQGWPRRLPNNPGSWRREAVCRVPHNDAAAWLSRDKRASRCNGR